MHEVFERQAARTPDAVAVVHGSHRMDFRELDERAERLAGQLVRRGVGPDVVVGMCVERGFDMVVGVLGILKAGGAYVALDPVHPPERLSRTSEDACLGLVVTRRRLTPLLPRGPRPVLLDELPERPEPPGVRARPAPASLAYLMYTSGSTGTPKGVLVTHANLISLHSAWERLYGLRAAALKLVSVSGLSVDLFLADLLRSVFAGGTVVIAEQDVITDPSRLFDLVTRSGGTAMELVPSLAKLLAREAVSRGTLIPPMRLLSVGSEGWLAEDCRELLAAVAPGSTVVNAYGTTETTVDSCVLFLDEQVIDGAATVPVGPAVAGTTVHVLDAALRPVPAGGTGELYIAGPGLARGYHGRPGATALTFVAHPCGAAGERLYRTGDLVRRRADGHLDFLGRTDGQVKIHGHRVETAEVENALVASPGVRDAAVAVKEDGGGRRRLVGYVVTEDGGEPDAARLRDRLAGHLPEHMVPTVFVALDRLPRLPGGKTDRRALPDPRPPRPADAGFEAPRTDTERMLARVWSEVLGVPRIGRDDDFFRTLGGDSVLAMQVAARARAALGAPLPPGALFRAPTLADLATETDATRTQSGDRADECPAAAAHRDPRAQGDAPLRLVPSHAQRRLWFLHQYDPGPAYHVGLALRLVGALDPVALDVALNWVVARHEGLRTTFGSEAGRCVQVVHPRARLRLAHSDLSGLPGPEREAATERLQRADLTHPFDLAELPLLRPRLVRLGEHEHLLTLTAHHIITDDWSYEVLAAELGTCYSAAVAGARTAPDLPPLPLRHADHAVRQHRRMAENGLADRHLAYWRRRLDGMAPLELPRDRPRTARTGPAGRIRRTVLPQLRDRLAALGREQGATLYVTLLAACMLLLARRTGRQDIAVGTVVSGRDDVDLEGLVGFFADTVVLRGTVDERHSFAELLGDVRGMVAEAVDHAELPFDRLVEELAPDRHSSQDPLVQVLIVMANTPARSREFTGLAVTEVDVPAVAADFDLTVEFRDTDDGLRADFLYRTDLFDASTVERLASALQELLDRLGRDGHRPLRELPRLTGVERREPVLRLDGGPAEDGRCVHEVFAEQVRRHPDATAVVRGREQLTYRELDHAANQLAHHLVGLGVGPDTVAGICLDRGPEFAVAALAVLKASGAFLPLDSGHPPQRHADVLADAAPLLIVTDREHAALLPEGVAPLVRLDAEEERTAIARRPGTAPRRPVLPQHLAYVVHTSGSTGRPKGVQIPHAGLTALAADSRRTLGLGPGARMLQHLSCAFDGGLWQILMPLLTGAAVCFSLPEERLDPYALARRVRADGTTVLMLPPALLGTLDPAAVPDSVLVCSAADVCPADTARAWAAGHSFGNLYGPTETTMCSTAHLVPLGVTDSVAGADGVPIGRPVAGARHYVLDPWLRPVSVGTPGELHIAGAGLARGYLGQPAQTAAHFVADPFGALGSRMYRTGDLVRLRGDGTLTHLGRVDDQVKIRGHRVEPAETAAALRAHPDVAEAFVTAWRDEAGEARLVAYVVPRPGRDAPAGTALRRLLGRTLPAALIPSVFVAVPVLPLNASGKVDRGALPRPGPARAPESAYAPPETPAQRTLAGVWSAALGVERVGVDDDFFDLGGDSITSVRLVAEARAAGLAVTPKDVFERPTVRALAEAARAVAPAAENVPARRDRYPLTPLQAGLLYHSLAGRDLYARRITLTLAGIADADALARAWQHVVDQTPALRSTVHLPHGGRPEQIVHPEFRAPVTAYDWRGLGPDALRDALAALTERDRGWDPDPRQAPPLRLALARTGEDEMTVLWTTHHLFVDGWSVSEILTDVLAAYEDLAAGRAPAVVPRRPFADYVQWLRDRDRAESRAHWQAELDGRTAPTPLPYGRRPAPGGRSGPHAGHTVTIPLPEHERLRAFARRHRLTLNTLVQAAWALLLSRHAGTDDVVFGATVSTRDAELPDAGSIIGLLVNTLPVRIRVDERAPLLDWLRALQARQVEARRHATFPLSELPGAAGRFDTALAFDNIPYDPAAVRVGTVRVVRLDTDNTTHYPLSLLVHSGGALVLQLDYDTTVFTTDEIARLADELRTALLALAAVAPDAPVAAVPLTGESAPRDTAGTRGAPEPACVHHLFAAQAARTPDATALSYGDGERADRVTYAELDARSNRLAHHLIGCGARPEALVAVALPRGVDRIAAQLAVLKAGAAFLPLDPDHPGEHAARAVADSGAALLLTRTPGDAPWRPGTVRVVALDGALLDRLPDTAPEVPVRPDSTAYTIYTSGSTGSPKGVDVTHRGVTGMLAAVRGTCAGGPGSRVLQFAAPSFDAAFWETCAALLTGATLVLASAERLRPGPELARTLAREAVTHVTLPPAVLGMLPDGTLPRTTAVVSAGEHLPAALAARLAVRNTVFNAYGPTESTVCATVSGPLTGDGEPPIGTPVPGTRVYVLDARLRPVPTGAAGELYLAGTGLARGYRERPAQTALRFTACPYGPSGARMYRTGDRVRRRADGGLEFLGRVDDQVKVRGFRVEPAEVEAALTAHPAVAQAAVTADGTGHTRRLTAHLVPAVPADGTAEVLGAVRADLARRLPGHLVPSAWLVRDSLPLTPHGKVDRHRLGAAPPTRPVTGRAPRGATERWVAREWARLVGRDGIGAREKFFEAGGTSLSLLELAARLNPPGREPILIADLLDHSTVEEMARLLDERGGPPSGSDSGWDGRAAAATAAAAGASDDGGGLPPGLAPALDGRDAAGTAERASDGDGGPSQGPVSVRGGRVAVGMAERVSGDEGGSPSGPAPAPVDGADVGTAERAADDRADAVDDGTGDWEL
ncbi:amino acid adenylation domain-containing protein [Streptomyces sp. YC419]|uniref:Amino acid adenylation domain-containing protein n=1 Tax=Streptomyces ureilyticus TaxID=1775131 RepID=A0ABX0DYF0_9ACTN|nr:amino acid adenylation domain-containing protein [Streptomyces ureilyticus]